MKRTHVNAAMVNNRCSSEGCEKYANALPFDVGKQCRKIVEAHQEHSDVEKP